MNFSKMKPAELVKFLLTRNESIQGATEIDMEIPIEKEVFLLHRFLNQGDNVQLYVVGGAVRDFLYHHFNGVPGSSYKHKDVDLATNLSEQEVLRRLGPGTEAEKAGVRVNEKESDTFGVVFVHFNGEDYEIAPFRIDIGSTDGRRPDRVEQGSIQEDAMRRDLTMNNLYYDFNRRKILDFNGNGQGVNDVREGIARPVGDPFERFEEDKLRVLRLIRFFSRFNDGRAADILDQKTLRAIENYKDVRAHGITPERIQDEFLKGIPQAQSTTAYLQNYIDLDLMNAVFPGLHVDVQGVNRLNNTRSPRVIYAWILRGNRNVDKPLHLLKYDGNFRKSVQFLIDAMHFGPDKAMMIIKNRDRQMLGSNASKTGGEIMTAAEIRTHNDQLSQTIKRDLAELSVISGNPELARRLNHLGGYQLPKIDAQELMRQGFQGPEIGEEMNRQTMDHYTKSFEEFE